MGTEDSSELRNSRYGAHEWIERHAGWLTFYTTLLMVFVIVINVSYPTPQEQLAPGQQADQIGNWILSLPAALFLMSAIILFTRPLGQLESEPTPINSIFRFGYAFMFALIVLGGVALYSPGALFRSSLTFPKAPNSTGDANQRLSTLLAIVPGCDYNSVPEPKPIAPNSNSKTAGTTPAGSDAANAVRTNDDGSVRRPNQSMPPGAYCGELPPQWVVSIGGSVLRCHLDGTCPLSTPPAQLDTARLETDIATWESDLAQKKRELVQIRNQVEQAERRIRSGSGGSIPDSSGERREKLNTEIGELPAKISAAKADLKRAQKWTDNPLLSTSANPIVGGLVVPVYFVVLAVMGALIGMMRKMPEFQQRVEFGYRKEFMEAAEASEGPLPPISRAKARDFVSFQILQVMAAPAIAILAFSWARPEQLATTTILGFAAGFSSEVFLMAIRDIVDRAIGAGPRSQRATAIMETTRKQEQKARDEEKEADKPTPTSVGGLKVGDAVLLVKKLSTFEVGAKGMVLSITTDSKVVVELMQDSTGMPIKVRLEPAAPDVFKKQADDNEKTADPVG